MMPRVNQHYFLKKPISFTVTFILLLLFSFELRAQNDSSNFKSMIQRDYAFRLHYGVIYAHSIHIQNTAGAHPRGAEFEFGKRVVDEKIKNYYGCFARTG